jgi:molybdopterin synthase catalytic subunit
MKVSVQREDFDLTVETDAIRKNDPLVGAVASFVGQVRDVSMILEHYPGMTEKALEKIVEEACARWKIIDCTVIHRYGELKPTEQIVLVAVASAHRGEAFAACEFIMDYLKTRAPFWKKEQTAEGPRWVEAKSSDDEAAGRWQAGAGAASRPRRRPAKP